jgi:adenine-specific DNA-methyltransferase
MLNSSNTTVYGTRSNGNEHGVVYTNREVVDLMLDSAGLVGQNDLRAIKILDPAAGDGVFVLTALERLQQSSKHFNWQLESALGNVKAVEIDPVVARELIVTITKFLEVHGVADAERYAQQMVIIDDFLTSTVGMFETFDLIIGNPPYIRHEQIPEQKKTAYRHLFYTFAHRSDIYIGFFEKGLKLLSPNGKLCFICSNRWMKAKYGERLRSLISKDYGLEAIIDIEDDNAFEEKVSAYAAVVLINSSPTNSYRHMAVEDERDHKLNLTEIETPATPTTSVWFGHPSWGQDTQLLPIEEQGFKIGIGVATGADKVYVGKDLPIEHDLVLPIALSRDISGGEFHWSGNYLFNPYKAGSSELVDLNNYPRAKSYLDHNKEAVTNRHTAKANPQKWYKTIDRVYAELVGTPKLLIPDMKKSNMFPIDEGKYYPHHNLYYITGGNVESLKVIGALLSTEFVRKQIEAASVLMRGGYARWQSQNIRRVHIPNIDKIPAKQKKELIHAYDTKDIQLADIVLNKLLKEREVIEENLLTGKLAPRYA